MSTLSSVLNQSRQGRSIFLIIGLLWILLSLVLLAYRQLTPPQVEITWETATEQGTAGFNLYRSLTEDGDYFLVNEGQFIESQGGPASGASYSYVDDDVVANQTYFYVLEEIENSGSRQRYTEDVFEYRVPDDPIWLTLLIAGCLVLGILLVIAGVREGS